MIGRLRGLLIERCPPHLLLEVGGIGYELEAPMTTFYTLPPLGQETVLYTHLVVREDAHTLYAFANVEQRSMFRSLICTRGIGARMALAILSGIEIAEFVDCVRSGDTVRLEKIPGIGHKTAERLLLEMRDRLPAGTETDSVKTPAVDASTEAEQALIALGYKSHEARHHVRKIATSGMDSEAIIRAALRQLIPS